MSARETWTCRRCGKRVAQSADRGGPFVNRVEGRRVVARIAACGDCRLAELEENAA